MANRGDVISVDKLWDIFDLEREKAWKGVDAPRTQELLNVRPGAALYAIGLLGSR